MILITLLKANEWWALISRPFTNSHSLFSDKRFYCSITREAGIIITYYDTPNNKNPFNFRSLSWHNRSASAAQFLHRYNFGLFPFLHKFSCSYNGSWNFAKVGEKMKEKSISWGKCTHTEGGFSPPLGTNYSTLLFSVQWSKNSVPGKCLKENQNTQDATTSVLFRYVLSLLRMENNDYYYLQRSHWRYVLRPNDHSNRFSHVSIFHFNFIHQIDPEK